MNRMVIRSIYRLSVAAALAAGVFPGSGAAASLINLGHAAGAQCEADSVNDSGIAVGACMPGSTNASPVAWVAVAGAEAVLAPLTPNQACAARAIANSGLVVGECVNAASVPFAVTWSGAAPATPPLKLNPLPGLLGLGADVSTAAGAFNQSGVVAGQSVSSNGSSTAVIWAPGSGGAPQQVSATGDNCAAVDIVDSMGTANPTVLLDCPNASGTNTPKVAIPGLLGNYVMTALPFATSSTDCGAAGIDNALEIVGTCVYATPPFSRLVLWSTPTSVPAFLNLPNSPGDTVGKASAGMYINNAGDLVYSYRLPDGRETAGFIHPGASPLAIPPLTTGATVSATGFGDNDLVVLVGENAAENTQPAVFDPASPSVVTPVALIGGGANAVLGAVSKNGMYSVGDAEDASHQDNAVIAVLP